MAEIIYERLADDMNEARYFEPPYDDGCGSGYADDTPAVRITPRPESAPLPANCPGCVDECHCTEVKRLLGEPQCEFCADLERNHPARKEI